MVKSPRIYIRKARAADREAVMRFTEHTYEWGDYIPMVWENWFYEPGSELLVAVVEHQPVAILHLVMVSRDEAWLEGMRVDAECRRLGIATRLGRYSIKRAIMMGAETVRFVTTEDNTPIHHMAASLGFNKVMAVLPYFAKALPPKKELDKPAKSDLKDLLEFLSNSTVLKSMGGLVSTHWRFHRLTPEMIEEKLKAGMGRKVGTSGKIDAFALVDTGRGLEVSFIDGTPDALKILIRGLRGEGFIGYEHKGLMARLPEEEPVRSKLEQARLKPFAGEIPFWLYELKIDNSKIER